ncbi:hypothetical protein BC834DRAFT_888591 [Gloeopeniophorella convolvens]|nr:hypothetical protein BC834DRAFT_888591 [Gloeopeniophorella convolvens]
MQHGERQQVFLPIACRYVASDQWFTTQFDDAWKIAEVKQYILSKVHSATTSGNDYLPSRTRPVSPITFASVFPSRQSVDTSTEGSLDDDYAFDSESDLAPETTRWVRPRQGLFNSSPAAAAPEHGAGGTKTAALPAHHYQMLAFSTGQLLEDDYSLAWYRLRPHELLELHPPGTIVRLRREVMLEYVQPYLELDVRALRVVISDRDAHGHVHVQEAPPNKIRKQKDAAGEPRNPAGTASGTAPPQSIRKRRKTKLEWRDRYLVIHHGMLNLFKSRADLTPVHTCSLESLTTLRGHEDVVRAAGAAAPSQHVVCAKFRVEIPSANAPEPPLASSPTADNWHDPWSGDPIPREANGGSWGRRGSKEDMRQHRRSVIEGDKTRSGSMPKEDSHDSKQDLRSESFWNDINIGEGTQGIWLILDTLEEFAHSNLLRVLHRCSPETISSTLVPSFLLPDSSVPSVPPSPSSYSDSLRRSPFPYPEWRIEVSQRAQKSGLGNVTDAMSWILWKGPAPELPGPKAQRTKLRKRQSGTLADGPEMLLGPQDFEEDFESDFDGECELEWESWAKDLARQGRSGTGKQIAAKLAEPSPTPRNNRERLGPATSSSTLSSMNMGIGTPDHTPPPTSPTGAPRRHAGVPTGAHMDMLSVDSPALLTAPSVLPFPSTGVTTSTVSVGGVVRARSLLAVDEGHRRGVPRAMEVVREDARAGGSGGGAGKARAGKQKHAWERERDAFSPTATQRSAVSQTSTIMSNASTVRSVAPTSPPATALTMPKARPTRRPSTATDSVLAELSSLAPANDAGRAGGSDKASSKGRLVKRSSRSKAFSPERLVSRFDSALDFVGGG